MRKSVSLKTRTIILAFSLFCLPILTLAQVVKHPTAEMPGQFSEITDREIYTYIQVYQIDMLLIEAANKLSEQELFYFGYFDAFKHKDNKDNPAFYQNYIIPPHTVPVFKKAYMDITEVANIHYQEFMHFLERDSGEVVRDTYLPLLDDDYLENYYQNPEFYFFPAIGMDSRRAQAYCKWRAENLNEGLEEFLAGESAYAKYKYVGRLPSEMEWKKLAGKVSEEIYDKTYEISKKAQTFLEEDIVNNGFADEKVLSNTTFYGYNVNLDHDTQFSHQMKLPYYVYGFIPMSSGLYNMYGNVKEIVKEGYAVGGSYLSKKDAVELLERTDEFKYKTDIGFRCLTQVKR